SLPARVTARNINQVIARRPHPRRDTDPAAPGELAARLEASGFRRCAAEEASDESAYARPERCGLGWLVGHRVVGPSLFGHRAVANELIGRRSEFIRTGVPVRMNSHLPRSG